MSDIPIWKNRKTQDEVREAMPHSSYQERLSEITRKLCHDFEDPRIDSVSAQAQADAAITSLMLDVVGKNGAVFDEADLHKASLVQAQNELRDQIRNTLTGDKKE